MMPANDNIGKIQKLRMVRVLHVIADPGTGFFILSTILRNQKLQGYSVEIATGPGEYLKPLAEKGYPVHVFSIKRKIFSLSHFRSYRELRSIMEKGKYDIVHTHTPIASFIGRMAAAKSKIPIVIYHMRGSWWSEDSFLKRILFTLSEKNVARYTTHVFTINCKDADELYKRRIFNQYEITCLHCGGGGIDLSRFTGNYSREAIIKCRKELNIDQKDFLILFIGRVVQEKGINELVQAFEELVDRKNDSIKLLIIGGVISSERDQSTMKKLKNKIIANGRLNANIRMMGFSNEIPKYIAASDVLVLPSYREGFGMVLAEAAAMGKPVVAARTRGSEEAVDDGKTGILIPQKDAAALMNALETLRTNEKLRNRMGENGRKKAMNVFCDEVITEKINKVYKLLLER